MTNDLKLPSGSDGGAEIVIVAVVDVDLVSLVSADGVDHPVGLGMPFKGKGRGVEAGALVDQHGTVGIVIALLEREVGPNIIKIQPDTECTQFLGL
ncbi:MAG: hypothetical protein EBT07_18400, partial [Actinobacteria bacterium]|nr:hypothetical protein [Actinomycetota bacterium]